MAEKFFLTTPIYYVNARPHIGHAYTTIVADVLARRSRAQGIDTFFLTGTDEHGQKIERSAQAAGIPPQKFTDQVSQEFRTLWDRMGLTYDKFIRTTDEAHKRGVQKLWLELESRGHIYLDSYTGAYCVSDEAFVDVPAGEPCPDCGRITEIITEENYFFRLSAFQQPVIDLIESGQLTIEPDSRRNEVLSFLRGGLKDLSISRSSFKWGIPVPDNEKHVVYVWLDALANYMTALGYGSDDDSLWQRHWPADLHIVGKEIIRFHCVYWPAFLLAAGLQTPKKVVAHGWLLFEESKMSKSKGNIVRTETILDAFGTLCPAPPAESAEPNHKTVILSERSESKDPDASSPATTAQTTLPTEPVVGISVGLQPHESATEEKGALAPGTPSRHQRDLFASDVLRYFLLREIPFGQDGSFSFDAMITRYNADLANGYGNLVSRTLKLIEQNIVEGFEQTHGAVFWFAEIGEDAHQDFSFHEENMDHFGWFVGSEDRLADHDLDGVPSLSKVFGACLANNEFNKALRHVWTFIGLVDGYISTHAPWKLAKSPEAEDKAKLEEVLYTAAESIRIITALLYPILPYATANVWRQLGLGDIEQAAENGELKNLQWGGLKAGTKLGPSSPIFPRADKGLAQTMSDMETEKNLLKQAEQTDSKTEFVETAIASEKSVSSMESVVGLSSSDPAAPPRTSAFSEPNPGSHVAASTAATTGPNPSLQTTHSEQQTTPFISIDDFIKIELRVAKILVAERIPKADKLLRLEVDLGYEQRQILSGIAEWYTPEDLIGRRIVVITNLAPRRMRGLESHGMLLAASTEGGKPYLATFAEADDLPLGSRLK